MEKKNNKGLIILVVFLVLVVIGLASFIVIDKLNNTSDKTNDNKITENEDKKDELMEVNEEDYEILVDRLMYHNLLNYELLDKNYTIDNISEDFMQEIAIFTLNTNRYKNTEEIAKNFKLYESYEEFKDKYGDYVDGIPAIKVKNNLKTIFNKDVKLSDTIGTYKYVSSIDAYVYDAFGSGYGREISTGYLLYKAEKKGDELYTYLKVYIDDDDDSAIYDYAKATISNEQLNIDKLPTPVTKKSNSDRNFLTTNYIKQNLDKFTTYKFTFKLIDGNYIYQKFEKM